MKPAILARSTAACRPAASGSQARLPRRPDEPRGEPARRPLQDAQRAIRLIRSRASEWGIHADRIGTIGFSAGGHLAISAATNFEQRSYAIVDEIDQASCRPDFAIPV